MTDGTTDERLGVRELAGKGALAAHYERASEAERHRLRIEAYGLLHPIVFAHLTRRVELRRGHRDCAVSISGLRPDCLDHFHDDIDAVLDDLFRNARVPVRNLEGWVSRRLVQATIDGYRRRRGARGALQRPRIPRWLMQELHDDGRLMELTLAMLEWVGQEATAGAHDWPIEAWAEPRIPAFGDYDSACRSVERDIATVVAAMMTRPRWYADYVERPMGRKRFPLARSHMDGPQEAAADLGRAALDAEITDDDRRFELAALAFEAIRVRTERGDDLRAAVVDVISTVFGAGTGSENMHRMPGHDSGDDEQVSFRLADSGTVDRIVAVVFEMLRE